MANCLLNIRETNRVFMHEKLQATLYICINGNELGIRYVIFIQDMLKLIQYLTERNEVLENNYRLI